MRIMMSIRRSFAALALAAVLPTLSASASVEPKVSPNATLAAFWRRSDAPALKPFVNAIEDVQKQVFTVHGATTLEVESLMDDIVWAAYYTTSDASTFVSVSASVQMKGTLAILFRTPERAALAVESFKKADAKGEAHFKATGALVLAAMNAGDLAAAESLYAAEGEKGEKSFAKFAADRKNVLFLYITDLGSVCRAADKANPGAIAGLDQAIPNGSSMLKGAKNFLCALKADGSKAVLGSKLRMKGKDDAAALKSVLDAMLSMFRMQMAQMPPESMDAQTKSAMEALNTISIGAKGATLSVDAPLPSALVDAMSEGMGETMKESIGK